MLFCHCCFLFSTTDQTAVPKILLVKNLTTQPQSINQQEPSIVNVSSSFPANSENGAKTLPVISATGAKIVRPPPGTVRFIKPVSLANIQTVQASSLKVRSIKLTYLQIPIEAVVFEKGGGIHTFILKKKQKKCLFRGQIIFARADFLKFGA